MTYLSLFLLFPKFHFPTLPHWKLGTAHDYHCAYTFILKATREVPRRLQNPKRKTIGIRIPDHVVTQAFLAELTQPLVSSTLILPNEDLPMTDPYQIRVYLEHQVDLIMDGGFCGHDPTTVIDLTGERPEILRQGKGEVDWLVEH